MMSSTLLAAALISLALRDGAGAAALSKSQTPTPNAAQQARALQDNAETLAGERKFDDALEAARESLKLRERVFGPRHALVARSLNTVGYVLYSKGDVSAAEAQFARALAIRRSARNTPRGDLFESLNNLASVLQAQGRLREAEPLLMEALAVLTAQKAAPENLGAAYNNLGGLLTDRGDFVRAQNSFQKAEELWRLAYPADHPRLATVTNNLGITWQERGDLPRAEELFARALAIREKGGQTLELARTLNNLGSALQGQGRLDEAEPLYQRAVTICEKLAGSDAVLGKTLNNLGVLYLLRKDYERARPLYVRALALRQKALGPEHPEVATSLAAYAIFLHNTGRIEEALQTQARAASIRERNLTLVLEVGSEAQKEQYLRLLADSIDVALWMRSVGGATGAEADRIALLTVLRRKGRLQDVLAASSDALRSRLSGAARTDLDELVRVRATVAGLVLQARGPAGDRASKVGDLEARAEALEAKLSVQSAQRAGPLSEVSLEAVQRAIPDGAVLIDFFRYRPFDPYAPRVAERFGAPKYAAYALRRIGDPIWTELGDALPIDAMIEQFRRALLNPQRADIAETAKSLLSPLTIPLMRLAGSSEHVLIAPDGDLNLLPFQALVDRDEHFLVERYRFTYLTSARDVMSKTSTAAVGPPLIISNPAFGRPAAAGGLVARSFGSLPGADREAVAVAGLLPHARTLRGLEASESNLKAAHSPVILHVATHGFYLAESAGSDAARTRGVRPLGTPAGVSIAPLLRSGLALAGANAGPRNGAEDGILTASEAALLDLRGTELVFLSACETGLGVVSAGESVYGLRRAFAIAGARSEVLTLWKVSDEQTSEFVIDFYKRVTAGADRSDALRAAQRAALADPSRRHPFYWAAFILSGSDGPLVPSSKP